MIDEELAKELTPPPPSMARWDRISTKLWALIDEEQRKDLPPVVWNDPPEKAIRLIDPVELTREQNEAADRADEALLRIEAKLTALREHRVARHPNCDKPRRTAHLRRNHDGGGGEGLLWQPRRCGRSDCPYCWRDRLTRTYNRAAAVLLPDFPTSETLPRTGLLHFAEIDWLEWEAIDKCIRRKHGGDVGRLRVHRADGNLLVVCAQPFRGSRPVTPAEACDLASDAIDNLHKANHTYRQLGDWNDTKPSKWNLVAHLPGTLNLGAVAERLQTAGRKSRQFRTPGARGLVWRVESEAVAVRLELLITTPDESCPTLSYGEYLSPKGPKSDTLPPSDDWGAVDDDCRTP